jgi:hypothetical protein
MIGFQADNKRFVGKSETFHFISCTTHNKGFSCPDLVVTYSAAILFEHPDSVFLTLVQVGNTQPFQVQSGETLVRAVILRADKAREGFFLFLFVPVAKTDQAVRFFPVQAMFSFSVSFRYSVAGVLPR